MYVRDSSFGQYKACVDIREVSLELGVKQTVRCRNRDFQCFRTIYLRPYLIIYRGTTNSILAWGKANIMIIIYLESLVGFLVILKQVTLNDLEWPFYVKICFYASMLNLGDCGFQRQLLQNNKDRSALSATQMFSRDSIFWWYKVYVDIRRGSVESMRQKTVGLCVK